MVIKLACSYYNQTSIEPQVLIEAANQANWSLDQPFKTVIQVLSGNHSDEESAILVATDFLYDLWQQDILPERRGNFILSILDSLAIERQSFTIIQEFFSAIKWKFRILPLAVNEIYGYIKLWQRIHLL